MTKIEDFPQFSPILSILYPIIVTEVIFREERVKKQDRSNKDASKGRMFKKIVLNCFKLFKNVFFSMVRGQVIFHILTALVYSAIKKKQGR